MVKYLPRTVEERVKKFLGMGKSVVVVGPRQAGKTTLLKHLSEVYRAPYFSLDDPETLEALKNVKVFRKLVEGPIFFLDEAQRDEEIGKKLKYLYNVEGLRFVVSGSGSFDIRVRVSGELVGRAFQVELLPLSFGEFLLWKDERLYGLYDECKENVWSYIREGEKVDCGDLPLRSKWEEYVTFGGYPEVVLGSSAQEKWEILSQILFSFVDRDALSAFGVKRRSLFLDALRLIAKSVGSLFSKSSVANALGTTYLTVDHYVEILLSSFIVFEARQPLRSFSDIRKRPKLYFYDLGLRNLLSTDKRPFSLRDDKGRILENYVARRIREEEETVTFYRKKNLEINFLVRNTAIEVKLTPKPTKAIIRAVKEGLAERALLVGGEKISRVKGIPVIPPWML